MSGPWPANCVVFQEFPIVTASLPPFCSGCNVCRTRLESSIAVGGTSRTDGGRVVRGYAQLPQSTSATSEGLSLDDGWLTSRREGTRNLYRMTSDQLEVSRKRLWQLVREQALSEKVVAPGRCTTRTGTRGTAFQESNVLFECGGPVGSSANGNCLVAELIAGRCAAMLDRTRLSGI